MSDFQSRVREVIARWRDANIPIRPGVSEHDIKQFEARYGIKLPGELNEYFATVDGTGDEFDDEWLYRFWPLKDVQPANEYVPELKLAFPESAGYFLFFDHSIEIFMFAIRMNDSETRPAPIARVSPQYDYLNFQPFCDSFDEFLSKYLDHPANLLG